MNTDSTDKTDFLLLNLCKSVQSVVNFRVYSCKFVVYIRVNSCPFVFSLDLIA